MSEEMQKSDVNKQSSKPATSNIEPDDSSSHLQAGRLSDYDDQPLEERAAEAEFKSANLTDSVSHAHLMEDSWADPSATSDDRLIVLLCYWSQLVMPFVMPIIVLLSESGKQRPFQRYHAMQSLGLTGGLIGLSIFITMGIGLLQAIPLLGFVIAMAALCLSPIAYLMVVIAYVLYGWQANKGKRFSIPILSQFMRQQGWLD